MDLDPGIAAPEAARFTRPEGDGDGGSFYQAHFYVNPVLYWLEVVTDFPCLERGSFDLAYLTEVDPLWNDDELTLILNPDAVLFANPVAIAACAADCVAATAGFGLDALFWCAGCQGGIYPLDGHVPYHLGGVRTAALLSQRLTPRCTANCSPGAGTASRVCAGRTSSRPWTRRAYKTQLTYPIAEHRQDRRQVLPAASAARRCCGAPARSTRSAARTSPSCSSGRGTAVSATDRTGTPRGLARVVRCLACRPARLSSAAAPPAPVVTDADVARAAKGQPVITEADEAARRDGTACPRTKNSPAFRCRRLELDALPRPATRAPIDLGAIAKGFEASASPRPRRHCGGAGGPALLVFVSFSMPEASLRPPRRPGRPRSAPRWCCEGSWTARCRRPSPRRRA